ncbi:glycosyltransferase [Roseiflexus castenholzii]|uniref:Glycosyl transferase group 1 n=1 Tax=Roseiflexus castenholzii (strain DSM 13941 / HLO8) TaxID=383372 RepID=A7NH96_ROSCS|nr:glycosyltransferase [Roseiflexus castenholzii]ABU56843.1 glycosyl transferase group 1 [Roseiflexus castenholzii DSM 13941]
MRIAIDARLNAYRTGGIAQYTRQLMAALADCAADDQIISLQHREHLRPLVVAPNVVRHPLYTPPHHRFERWILPLELLAARPHVVHFPDFIAPRHHCCPTVVTIHDLAFLRYPDILDSAASAYYRQVGDSAARADAVIAVSETTREDIAQFLDLPPERIDVIYEAAAPIYTPLSLRPGETRVLAGTPVEAQSFMLFVSTLEPRKNLPSLLRALRICLDRRPDRAYRLVVAGARGWRDEDVFSTVRDLHLAEHVLFAGRVGQYDLRWLYNACRFYINPSLYEGFGLPLLEAMACGAACLASSSASLPEIGSDAVDYIPPLDIGAWADGIEMLWDDEERRETMGRLARARAEQFSWQRAARETLAVYRRAAAGAPRPTPAPIAAPADPSPPDRLVVCRRCGQRLVSAPVKGTIVVTSSPERQITPRAWVCPRCDHIELLAVPTATALIEMTAPAMDEPRTAAETPETATPPAPVVAHDEPPAAAEMPGTTTPSAPTGTAEQASASSVPDATFEMNVAPAPESEVSP